MISAWGLPWRKPASQQPVPPKLVWLSIPAVLEPEAAAAPWPLPPYPLTPHPHLILIQSAGPFCRIELQVNGLWYLESCFEGLRPSHHYVD